MEPSVDNNPQPNTSAPADSSEPASTAPSEPASPEESASEASPTTPGEPTPESEPTPEPTPAPEPDVSSESLEPKTDAQTKPTEPIVSVESSETQVVAQDSSAPKKKSLVALIVILFIVLLAGIGFLVWYLISGNGNSSDGGQSSGINNQTNQNQPLSPIEPIYNLSQLSDFDLAFLRSENVEDNIVYSPLSIKYALAMLSEAAAGESKTQISNIIGDYQPTSYINDEHRSLANAMFIRDKFKDNVSSSYTQAVEQKFNASVIYDPFSSPAAINNWVSNQTMGIIDNLVGDDDIDKNTFFVLVNALAIDMNWNNQLQCKSNHTFDKTEVPCKWYYAKPMHEDYYEMIDYISDNDYSRIQFNGNEVITAEIGTTANRYNIIKELGDDYIRSTVLAKYEEWKTEEGIEKDEQYDIDTYMEQLASNYDKIYNSTDFYFSDTDDEKVFAKDLKEYDGATLQYVGIMPKNKSLSSYLGTLTAEKTTNLINDLKDASRINSFKDGVITKIKGNIPFFNYNYNLNLKENLEKLGVVDVFDPDLANLTNLITAESETAYIQKALHKADIEFSNDGIRAAAATGLIGGLGAAWDFDYLWEVPVEEIDLTFDQPFLFLIRDKVTSEVWFIGTVYHPSE